MLNASSDAPNLSFDPSRLPRIADWMQRDVDGGRFAGSSVLLSQGGKEVYHATAGLRSIDQKLIFERDTIARIYSMTKMITSVALMMLVEKGLVHLDAPLSRYLPEFSKCHALIAGATGRDQVESCATPTISQLLTHTSGMSYSFNPGTLAEIYAQHLPDQRDTKGGLAAWTKLVADMPLAFAPGSQWNYSIGIDVIGSVVEAVSGQSLDVFFKQEIFDPLGMVDTGFDVPDDKIDRLADCYTFTNKDPLRLTDAAQDSWYRATGEKVFSGGGGLVSTLDDYMKFGEMVRREGAFDGGRLLSPSTLRFMRLNHLDGDIASMGAASFAEMPMYGTGFGIGGAVILDPAMTKMPGSVGDFGWGGMASTYFWTDPVHDFCCIFFTQLIPSSTYPNRAELKALVHGALTD